MSLKLYGYWRSSASYRVRIACHYKALPFEYHAVHLVKAGGEHKQPAYQRLNPAKLVPTLVDGEFVLNQSLAIIEYLEQIHPEPALIPKKPRDAAQVRTMALDMAADLQPITNLRVLEYLTGTLAVADEAKLAWIKHWVQTAFQAYETRLKQTAGQYSFGDQVSLADVCLIPQVYNAERFQVDLTDFPTLVQIAKRLNALPAFQKAHPQQQPDAQPIAP